MKPKPMTKSFLAIFTTALLACQHVPKTPPPAPPAERPKNIVLLIGDGMAAAQATAGMIWAGKKSCFERFPVVGFHKSHSSDDLITDSAAGATAFACGCKTTNGTIGQYPDGRPCRTILEQLDSLGWATGMVVTCSATHATPACFIAHQDIRAFTELIALDYLRTPLDCFIGGGEEYFNARLDGLNLEDSLRRRGYAIFRTENFKKLPLGGQQPFLDFISEHEPATASAGRRYLPDAAQAAIQFLKNRSPKGYFLMIEGSQIDWACHANDREYLQSEMLDFNRTVNQVLDLAAADGETLVIVTGDHDCGGLSLNEGLPKSSTVRPTFATKLHTGVLVPVYAFGPQAGLFSGIYQNTAIHDKMWAAIFK